MGESKRRKAKDPNYGKIRQPYRMSQRESDNLTGERLKLKNAINTSRKINNGDIPGGVAEAVGKYLGKHYDYWTDSMVGAVFAILHRDKGRFKFCYQSAINRISVVDSEESKGEYLKELVQKVLPEEWESWIPRENEELETVMEKFTM